MLMYLWWILVLFFLQKKEKYSESSSIFSKPPPYQRNKEENSASVFAKPSLYKKTKDDTVFSKPPLHRRGDNSRNLPGQVYFLVDTFVWNFSLCCKLIFEFSLTLPCHCRTFTLYTKCACTNKFGIYNFFYYSQVQLRLIKYFIFLFFISFRGFVFKKTIFLTGYIPKHNTLS